jgi:uncharacterized membrane protein
LTGGKVRAGRGFLAVLIVAVLAGIFFRIYALDRKLYNPDEVNTSIRVSGHTNAQVGAFLHDGATHRVADLARFAEPTDATSPRAVISSLAREDPQHPPLFFLADFGWQRIAGSSIAQRRAPALLFGLLALVAAWWFGRELFVAATPAWTLAALVALSPFHVAYAQEAREYSLFTLTIFASGALLLRALRRGAVLDFVLYAFAVAVGAWSFTLFLLIAAAQALYAALPLSAAPARRRIAAVAAAAAGGLTFVPWLTNLLRHAGVAVEDTSWQASALSAPLYAGKWLFNAGAVFFDLDYLSLAWLPIALFALGIAAAACVEFARRASPRVWFLPAAYLLATLAATLLPDLVTHQTRALQTRYMTAGWIAIEIATAGGFWYAMTRTRRVAIAAQAGSYALLACGLVSCAVSSQARTWWLTGSPGLRAFPAIVDRLAEVTDPTVVFLQHDDEVLLLEPYATPSMHYAIHERLDAAALRDATHPYAIVSSEALAASPVGAELTREPLALSFEMRPDPLIERLRRRGARERGLSQRLGLDYGLYAGPTHPSP